MMKKNWSVIPKVGPVASNLWSLEPPYFEKLFQESIRFQSNFPKKRQQN